MGWWAYAGGGNALWALSRAEWTDANLLYYCDDVVPPSQAAGQRNIVFSTSQTLPVSPVLGQKSPANQLLRLTERQVGTNTYSTI